MSVKIVQRKLPAGTVPYEDVADPVVKNKLMLLNRNIDSIHAQLSEVQRAAIELQKRPAQKQKEIEDIERYVAQAADSASAANQSANIAGQAKDEAVAARNAASGFADAASGFADDARRYAQMAAGAIKVKEFTITVSVDAGSAAAYSAYVDPDAEIGTDRVPILAVCTYSGYQKLCATQCNLSHSATGRWSVGIYVYNPDSKSHSGNAKVKVLYVPAS